MKRIAAILLFSLLLFNWIGYRLFDIYQAERANAQLEAKLNDNTYDSAELISFKLPASHLSYYNTSATFQRVDGQVEFNGFIYKFVGRRLYQDSIEFLCIPHTRAMQLKAVSDEFSRALNDVQFEHPHKKSVPHKNGGKNFSPDQFTVSEALFIKAPGMIQAGLAAAFSGDLSSSFTLTGEQPPDHLS